MSEENTKPTIENSRNVVDVLEENRLQLVQISKYRILIDNIANVASFIVIFYSGFDIFRNGINIFNLNLIFYIIFTLHLIYWLTNKWFLECHSVFREKFRSTIINDVMLGFSKGTTYQSQSYIESTYFDRSQIFSSYYNSYTGEDLISFTTFGDLKICEIDVKKSDYVKKENRRIEAPSNPLYFQQLLNYYKNPDSPESKEFEAKESSMHRNRTSTNETYNLFQGIFGYATFPFEFEGVTVLCPTNKLSSVFGNRTSVYLESPRFMEIWTVESTSQTGARLALNTDIMDNLLELNEKLSNKSISLSFVGNQVFFAISQNRFLDPDYKVSVKDQQSVKDFQFEIQTIQNIVETFKLDQSVNQNSMSNKQKLSVLKSQDNIPSLMNAQYTPMSAKTQNKILILIITFWLMFVCFGIFMVIKGK